VSQISYISLYALPGAIQAASRAFEICGNKLCGIPISSCSSKDSSSPVISSRLSYKPTTGAQRVAIRTFPHIAEVHTTKGLQINNFICHLIRGFPRYIKESDTGPSWAWRRRQTMAHVSALARIDSKGLSPVAGGKLGPRMRRHSGLLHSTTAPDPHPMHGLTATNKIVTCDALSAQSH
jgi:hypothetical protein